MVHNGKCIAEMWNAFVKARLKSVINMSAKKHFSLGTFSGHGKLNYWLTSEYDNWSTNPPILVYWKHSLMIILILENNLYKKLFSTLGKAIADKKQALHEPQEAAVGLVHYCFFKQIIVHVLHWSI